MRDLLSDFPAPLPLLILLRLPDLKALYAAILASPNIYAASYENAQEVYVAIACQSIRSRPSMPLLIYIRLMCKHYQESYEPAVTGTTWNKLKDTTLQPENIYDINRYNTPVAVIFHLVAQAVRIHDMACYILRSKLDYLVKLQSEQLVDPECR